MLDKMKNMEDMADKDVLQEIIQLMGQLNGQNAKGMSVNLIGQKDVDSLQLPGEDPSEIPEGESDDKGLADALADDSSEMDEPSEGDSDMDDDLDAEMQLRRKGKIF